MDEDSISRAVTSDFLDAWKVGKTFTVIMAQGGSDKPDAPREGWTIRREGRVHRCREGCCTHAHGIVACSLRLGLSSRRV